MTSELRLSEALELIKDRRLRPVCNVAGVYVGEWPTEWPGWGPHFSAGACPRIARAMRETLTAWQREHLSSLWRQQRNREAVVVVDLMALSEDKYDPTVLDMVSNPRLKSEVLPAGSKLRFMTEGGDGGWWHISWQILDGPLAGKVVESKPPGAGRGGWRTELADAFIWPASALEEADPNELLELLKRTVHETLKQKVEVADLFSYRKKLQSSDSTPAASMDRSSASSMSSGSI